MLFVVAVVLALVSACVAKPVVRSNMRGTMLTQMPHSRVSEFLAKEMADVDHNLVELEGQLRPIFDVLPKTSNGKVSHVDVQSALQRFFSIRYGWHIFGLDGLTSPSTGTAAEDLQATFEGMMGEGADLNGFAVLAAAVQDIIRAEAANQLRATFDLELKPYDKPLPRKDAEHVLFTGMVSYHVQHNITVAVASQPLQRKVDLDSKLLVFKGDYMGNEEVMDWFQRLVDRNLGKSTGAENETANFESMTNFSLDLAKEFHTVNDKECGLTKSMLQKLESKRPGRVRLSEFYRASLAKQSLWNFDEKAEYLRAMGALDETNPQQPYVVIANYMQSPRNCLKSSTIYSICCRNLCGAVREEMDNQIKQPTTTADRIALLVATMPSAVPGIPEVAISGKLSEKLRSRLDEIAMFHDGEIPLHGRLFTQWLHHAYPLDCPFPREELGIDHAALELLESSASQEEMQRQVDEDTCMVDLEGKSGCEESADLPWIMQEYSHNSETQSDEIGVPGYQVFFLVVAAMLAVKPLLRGKSSERNITKLHSLMVCSFLAYSIGLLKIKVCMMGLVLGMLFIVGAAMKDRRQAESMKLPKCV